MVLTLTDLWDGLQLSKGPGSHARNGYVILHTKGSLEGLAIDRDGDPVSDFVRGGYPFIHTTQEKAESFAEKKYGKDWHTAKAVGMISLTLSCILLGSGNSKSSGEPDDLDDVDLSEDLLSDPDEPAARKPEPEPVWHRADGSPADVSTSNALDALREVRVSNGEKGVALNTYSEYSFY